MGTHDKDLKNNNDKAKNDKAGDEIMPVPKAEYETLKSKAAEADAMQDKYLRLQAEFDNARRRMEKEKLDCLKYANEGFILELLPIIDNLEIAEKHIKEAKDFKAVQGGVDMIQAQMQGFLKDIGLERIKTVGGKFDPHMHEPIETEDCDGKEEDTIVAELKPGYMYNGKLFRPAAVRIVKKKTELNDKL
ncbi:MAG: nucleotide exchange factor GrpE [Candidatus Omnitrophota bacterium]